MKKRTQREERTHLLLAVVVMLVASSAAWGIFMHKDDAPAAKQVVKGKRVKV